MREFLNQNSTYSIVIDNIRRRDNYIGDIIQIVNTFAHSPELYCGFYKTDCLYLSREERLRYNKEIPAFLQNNGMYLDLTRPPHKHHPFFAKHELAACKISKNVFLDKNIKRVFDYYLETIFFCPKVNWEIFIESFGNYTSIPTSDYILLGYTDILFAYVDSGDFIITFNPCTYTPKIISDQITYILKD